MPRSFEQDGSIRNHHTIRISSGRMRPGVWPCMVIGRTLADSGRWSEPRFSGMTSSSNGSRTHSGRVGRTARLKQLRVVLAVNGLVFLLRGLVNLARPTSFYLERESPGYARDAVRMLGVTYGVFGLTQLGVSRSADTAAVRSVSVASMLFASGAAAAAIAQNADSNTGFRRLRLISAAENVGLATLYALLLKNERRSRR